MQPALRTITIDDYGSHVAKIVVRADSEGAPYIAEIVVCGVRGNGVPRELVDALIPHVGLPAGAAATPRDVVASAAPDAPEADPPEPSPVATPAGPPPRANGETPHVELAAPPQPASAPPGDPTPSAEPPAGTRRAYRRRPSGSELAAAVKLVGNSPSALGRHFDVPAYTAGSWVKQARKNREL